MREIVFVVDSVRVGGAQKVTLDLAGALADRGYTVRVVCYRHIEGFSVPSNVKYQVLYIPGISKKYAWDAIERLISRVFGKIWAFIFSYYCTVRLKRALGSADALVYLVSDSVFSYFFRVKRYYDVRVVLHSVKSKQYRTHLVNRLVYKPFLESVMRGVSVFAISKAIYEDIEANFSPVYNDLQLIRNFSNPDRIKKLAYDFEVPQHFGKYFLYVGRFSPEKRVLGILESYRRYVLDNAGAMNLVLVGDGPEKKSIEGYIQSNKLGDKVSLLGFKENPFPYISAAQALVLNSIREGFPTVISEALALECPIISSQSFSDIFDIFDDRYIRDFTYPVDDESRLSECLITVQVVGRPLMEPFSKSISAEEILDAYST